MVNDHDKRDAAALRLIVSLATERQIPESVILSGTELTLGNINQPNSEIEVWQEITAIRNFVTHDDDPALGVLMGERLHITSFGTLGFAMLSSRNLRQALKIATKFHSLSLWLSDVDLLLDEDATTFVIHNHMLPEECRHFVATRGMAALVVWMNEMLARKISPVQSKFKHAEPTNSAPFQRCFGSQFEFGADSYSITFDSELFDERLKFADRWTRLRSECELEMLMERRRSSVTNRVKDIVFSDPGEIRTEEEVSDAIGISASTLRRRLREEDTSFREIKSSSIHELACQMLVTSTMTIDQISYALGYSESASFGRAFKRRENIAPGEWRRRQR